MVVCTAALLCSSFRGPLGAAGAAGGACGSAMLLKVLVGVATALARAVLGGLRAGGMHAHGRGHGSAAHLAPEAQLPDALALMVIPNHHLHDAMEGSGTAQQPPRAGEDASRYWCPGTARQCTCCIDETL
jgi:hypothetical protein